MATIIIRTTDEMHKEIKELAWSNRQSMNQFLVDALKELLVKNSA